MISNLGGTRSDVTCPWCEGTGVRVVGIDAQASWLARRADAEREPAADAQQDGA